MQADKVTLTDLSIFNSDENQSVASFYNYTTTDQGRFFLQQLLAKPLANADEILQTQEFLQQLITILPQWPQQITNGTLMVVEKFYETPFASFPTKPDIVNAWLYRVLNYVDYSLAKYSLVHFIPFIQGMQKIEVLLHNLQGKKIKFFAEKLKLLLANPVIQKIQGIATHDTLTKVDVLFCCKFLKHFYRHQAEELLQLYIQLDAYMAVIKCSQQNNFHFPVFTKQAQPFLSAEALYHPLLPTPISYNFNLRQQENFLFLTGANMAGKSTFIKAIGIAVYLAHLGWPVPAKTMELCFFDGLLSNIQVSDNIIRGESYFFNEVQRIKATIERISDGKNWLILVDELFKGTNVQDAMKCSTVVIEGLVKMPNALFVLSTHLYEIAEHLRQYKNIQFKFFETSVHNDQLIFSYQLQEGVSNDRLGYLILKREGVVRMLEGL